jgi:hypothetical protein
MFAARMLVLETSPNPDMYINVPDHCFPPHIAGKPNETNRGKRMHPSSNMSVESYVESFEDDGEPDDESVLTSTGLSAPPS